MSERPRLLDQPFWRLVLLSAGVFSLVIGNPIVAVICFVLVWRATKRSSS